MNSVVTHENREAVLSELRRFDAERVFLAMDFYTLDESKQKIAFSALKDNCAFFKANGLEVGSWVWAFELPEKSSYRGMRSVLGKEHPERICPTDSEFVKFSQEYIRNFARCGVDIIMFDDDYTFNFLDDGGPGCLCDGHVALINGTTGESHNREELTELIMSGGKNKYRDAYLKANGDSLRAFAKAIREAVDEIDPNIRIGKCSCMASWDIDGTTSSEIARILAGKNKPFYRFIGAPYWAVRTSFGVSLQDAVELERMESSWDRYDDIEVFAEGDVYPRPRYNCPASYLEGFDTALRASGCTDGILKYGMDYNSEPYYEQGYAKFHEKNRSIYKGIDEMFKGKKHTGIRVYESMKKIADMEMDTAVNAGADIEYMFQPKAARTLAHNSIPSTYEGEGVCGIVFDENARALPLSALKNGLILDIAAAEILMKRGVDVGINKIGDKCDGQIERNLETGNKICHYFIPITVFNNEFNKNAKILSVLETENGDIPLSYLYENADGNKFLVFNANSRPNGEGRRKNTRFGPESVFRNYERSRQIAEFAEYASGKKLPAYVYSCPEMYIQCKEADGKLAVGLWNFFADEAFDFTVELSESYSKIKFLNCEGSLDGNKVTVKSIPAFEFGFFEVEK